MHNVLIVSLRQLDPRNLRFGSALTSYNPRAFPCAKPPRKVLV
jgi:hypothetical protein